MRPPGTPAGESTPPEPAPRPLTHEVEHGATGLPGFPTWARVYWFVLGAFVLWILLLVLLGRAFR